MIEAEDSGITHTWVFVWFRSLLYELIFLKLGKQPQIVGLFVSRIEL